MALRPGDLVAIGAYFFGLFVLGIVCGARQTSREEYFLGDRRIPSWLAGISVFATLLSTVTYVALPGEMIKNGIGFFTQVIGFLVIVPVVTRIVIPALMHLPVTSIYDYLERRFGPAMRVLVAMVFVLMRLIWLGLILHTAAKAIAPMTGRSVNELVVVAGVATLFYTTLGGMRAVMWSDLAQFVVLMGGALLIPIHVGLRTGAGPLTWWNIFSQAERANVPVWSFDPTVRTSVLGIVLMTIMWHICTHSSDQIAAQRYLSTPSAASAQRAFRIFSVANVGVILLLMVCGLALFYLRYHEADLPVTEFQQWIAAKADEVLPTYIAHDLPDGLSGFMVAALLAAAMSSLSSGINSIATVLINDFASIRPTTHTPEAETSLVAPRMLSIGAGSFGILVGLFLNHWMSGVKQWNLVDLIERVNHLFVAPLGAVFFSGIWFRHVGLAAVICGFCCGVLTSFAISFSDWLFGYPISFMWIMPASFAATIIAAYVAGFCFSRPSTAQLESLQ